MFFIFSIKEHVGIQRFIRPFLVEKTISENNFLLYEKSVCSLKDALDQKPQFNNALEE